MSFRKCKLAFLIRNIVHAEFKCGRNIKMNTWSKYYYYSTVKLYNNTASHPHGFVIAECLSVRLLIVQCSQIAYVCMYVCI